MKLLNNIEQSKKTQIKDSLYPLKEVAEVKDTNKEFQELFKVINEINLSVFNIHYDKHNNNQSTMAVLK